MIFALTGLAGVGKDTAAEQIADILGGAAIIALADGPKEMASDHFDLPINYFNDRDLKDTVLEETGSTPREMMVMWFDELFEEYGDDYTLQVNKDKIYDVAAAEHVIITDIRYPVEFAWVKEDQIPLFNIKREAVQRTINHRTERGSNSGVIVNNNGTIDELRNELVHILELLI